MKNYLNVPQFAGVFGFDRTPISDEIAITLEKVDALLGVGSYVVVLVLKYLEIVKSYDDLYYECMVNRNTSSR